MRAPLLLLLAALLTLGACRTSDDVDRDASGALVLGGVEQTETIERGVVPGQRALVLTGFSGEIRLSGVEEEEARLHFIKRVRGGDAATARKGLDDITIEESGDGAAYRYTMRSKAPARTSVDVEGTVPRGTPLQITLDNGTVTVRDVLAPLTIRVQNGRVAVAAAGGAVDVETQNANLVVGLARVAEDAKVRLSTENGRIALGLPRDGGARIDAESQVGTIRADGLDFRSQQLTPRKAGARFRATMGSGAAEVVLRTQNGSIELSDAERLTVITATPPDTTQAQ